MVETLKEGKILEEIEEEMAKMRQDLLVIKEAPRLCNKIYILVGPEYAIKN
jgi:hypothetical protein